MFPESDELSELLPTSFDDIGKARENGVFRTELQTNKHRVKPPESVETVTGKYWNPAVDAYKETLDWQPRAGWYPVDETSVLTHYPEYVPTDIVIEHLVRNGPIVEVAAGTGYWSAVVNRNGGDCIATDIDPPHVKPKTTFPRVKEYISTDDTVFADVEWDTVLESDHRVVEHYPDRDVLLCHPPGEKWPQDLLDHMNPDQQLHLVAEWYPGADATPLFFKKLLDDWELVKQHPVLDWASMNTAFYVFQQTYE